MDKIDYEAKLALEVEKLREYQQALSEEHNATLKANSDGAPLLDAAQVYAAAEQKLLSVVSQAADTIVNLVEYADKDATKFSVSKYVIELARDHSDKTGSEHPFEEILRKIAPKVQQED